MEYVIGTLFMIAYIIFFYFVGSAITKQKRSLPYQFMIGYLVYSFFVAIGAIPIMQLNLPFRIIAIYLVFVYLGLLIYSIFIYRKHKLPLLKNTSTFFKSQWFLYFISIVLVVVSLSYVPWLWLNNCTDDGYYLAQLTTFPITFRIHPSTGYVMKGGISTYLMNGYYAELAVYVNYLHIAPTVLCRVFFNFFHYFLFAVMIYLLADTIVKWLKIRIPENSIQYFSLILLLFSFGHRFVDTFHIFSLQDTWQFNTAMYYGSSTVRCFGLFLLILPFIEKEKIGFRDVLYVIGIGVGLISQSTIALPVILIVSYGYLVVHFLFDRKETKYKILGILLLAAYFGISILLPNVSATQNAMFVFIKKNLTSLILVPCVIVFILSNFTKNKQIYKINALFVFIFISIVLNPINNILENASIYSFVALRFHTMFAYDFIVLNFIYFTLFMYCKVFNHKHFRVFMYSLTAILLACTVFISHVSNEGFISKLKLIVENKEIMPNVTVQIGDILERRYAETKEYNVVVADEGIICDGYEHAFATFIRTETPHTISLSATGRYGKDTLGEYRAFTQDDQLAFFDFEANPNDDTYTTFKNGLEDIDVNCMILNNDAGGPILEMDGYSLYDTVTNGDSIFYIYVR